MDRPAAASLEDHPPTATPAGVPSFSTRFPVAMSPGEISSARRALQLTVTDDGPTLQDALAAARFEAIFRSCYPRVLAYVLRRTESREVAEEIVSEAFLIVWRRLEAVPLDPLPWILGTARKVLGTATAPSVAVPHT